jgi:uncharacterized protein
VLTLYQAEWCPFSSAVRELLTELGIDFVAKQVEPWPEQRETLREVAGDDQIPTLVGDDGDVYRGTRAILRFLEQQQPSPYAAGHRQRYHDHAPARDEDATGQLISRFRMPHEAASDEDRVVHVDGGRYELWRGDRRLGLVSYRPRGDDLTFIHTEIDPEFEGRGLGKKLIAGALDDVRSKGGKVVPLCPFVSRFIERNEKYGDLVAPSYKR